MKTEIKLTTKPEYQNRVSPVGVARFPKLLEPDTKLSPEKPFFCTGLIVDPTNPIVAKLVADIDEAHALAVKEANEQYTPKKDPKTGKPKEGDTCAVVDPPYEADLDRDGEPTGKLRLKFKANATITQKDGTKRNIQLPVKTSKGLPWPKGVEIGGGSELRVYFNIQPYYFPQVGVGVKLIMTAAQIKVARSFGPKIESMDGEEPDATDAGPKVESMDSGEAPKGAGGF